MSKKLICLFATVLFFVGFPSASPAAVTWWGEIWYGGYVQVQDLVINPPDDTMILVKADTAVVLFNPNRKTIQAAMFVYNKKGKQVAKSFFIDEGKKNRAIPPHGWGWLTLGMLVPPARSDVPEQIKPARKFTFRILIGSDETEVLTNPRAPVVEVKEIIYDNWYPPGPPGPFWHPSFILRWSETSLGGDNGTGFYWRP